MPTVCHTSSSSKNDDLSKKSTDEHKVQFEQLWRSEVKTPLDKRRINDDGNGDDDGDSEQ